MYKFWDSIIEPALTILQPRSIVEIGTSDGRQTSRILDYCRTSGAVLHAIDPLPNFPVSEWIERYRPHFVMHEDISLNVLGTIADCDAILIDGDHNWYTVYHELILLQKRAESGKKFPVVFLHDVGWPYARRDLYYDPERIPLAYRKPHARKGIRPDSGMLVEKGGMNANLWNAMEENDLQNGVLTAIEDFLKQTPLDLQFVAVPGLHGLGIIASAEILNTHPAFAAFFRDLQMSEPVRRHMNAVDRERIQYKLWEEEEQRARLAEWEAAEADRKILVEQKQQLSLRIDELLRERDALNKQLDEQKEHYAFKIQEEREAYQKRLAEERTSQRDLERIRELEQSIGHLMHTRSWRWTAPLRIALKPSTYLRPLYRLWNAMGQPFPGLARSIRHGQLANAWPVEHAPVPPPVTAVPTADVAVVIPCHNYAHFLDQAIESVLRQTLAPADIVVVDDSSTDATAEVAARYADRGVRYLRGDWQSVGNARNAGLDATTAPLLVFLDADNMLHPEYLRSGVQALHAHPDAGIAYVDLQYFGDKEYRFRTPDVFDWKQFDHTNIIDAVSMVRREALVGAGKWSHGIDQDGDWVTWRRVIKAGWKAVKSEGLCFYRAHGSNMHQRLRENVTYAKRSGFIEEPATLCIALSGRSWAWPLTARFLEEQTFPHDRLHLIIQDTSQDTVFGAMIEQWLASSDYPSHTYLRADVGLKGLADMDRDAVSRQVAQACVQIYNRFAQLCDTALVFFLEDDIVPPPDAYSRLIEHFDETVVSVAGTYKHRMKDAAVAWHWSEEGGFYDAEPSTGISKVGGNGFGCVVMRGEWLRHTTFGCDLPHWHYDINFYHHAVYSGGNTALIDWSCQCRHYVRPDTWQ